MLHADGTLVLPDGRTLGGTRVPELPLAPSAWSSLAPPAFEAAEVAAVHLVAPEATTPLAPAERDAVAARLAALSADGWVPSRRLNWAGARYLQVRLADGALVELQELPDGAGGRWLRLTSTDRPDVRAVRAFAFRAP